MTPTPTPELRAKLRKEALAAIERDGRCTRCAGKGSTWSSGSTGDGSGGVGEYRCRSCDGTGRHTPNPLLASLPGLLDDLDAADAEAERLRTENKRLHEALDAIAADAEAERLRTENKRLREALDAIEKFKPTPIKPEPIQPTGNPLVHKLAQRGADIGTLSCVLADVQAIAREALRGQPT